MTPARPQNTACWYTKRNNQGGAAVPDLQCVYTHSMPQTRCVPPCPNSALHAPRRTPRTQRRGRRGPVDFNMPDRASSQPI